MKSVKAYTDYELRIMNLDKTWNYNIIMPYSITMNYPLEDIKLKQSVQSYIYATGDCNTSGRIYIAIPCDKILNDDMIHRHNIWITDLEISRHNKNLI